MSESFCKSNNQMKIQIMTKAIHANSVIHDKNIYNSLMVIFD